MKSVSGRENDTPSKLLEIVNNFFDEKGVLKESKALHFHEFLSAIPQNNGHEVRCHDDVMDYVAELQDAQHRAKIIQLQLEDAHCKTCKTA